MKKFLTLFCTLLLLVFSSYSQFSYFASGYSTFAGTYTDLGSQGTVIDSSAYTGQIRSSNDVSVAMPIGFSFSYNSRNFTHFFLSTNGYIKLGNSAAPDSSVRDLNASRLDSNLIYPFNCRLEDAPGREYRVYTEGPPGSQVCTIQFKNVRDSGGLKYDTLNFQIKLYESGSKVEFVYGLFTEGVTNSVFLPANVGMWGSSYLKTINLSKQSGSAWSAATVLEEPYTSTRFNSKSSLLPETSGGRTFQFLSTVLPSNDAKVNTVYSLGEIPRTIGFPGHRVGARIENKGTLALNNLPVYLQISGANSFSDTATIVSLGVETSAAIYFDSIPGPGNPGVDTIRVMVGADANSTNDTSIFIRIVNDTCFSYADNSAPSQAIGFGLLSGVMLVKYRAAAPASVVRVKAFISDQANNVGKKVRGVIYNSLQQSLASTGDITLQATDRGKYLNMDFNPSVSVAGDFYVGLVQLGDNDTAYYPLAIQKEGPPTRRLSYFTAISGGIGVGITEDTTKGCYMIQANIITGPVPVILQQFYAEKKGKYNQLSWKITQEINVDHYILERSEQGAVFSQLSTISASGLSEYNYNDLSPRRGLNYYRLRIVYANGVELFSDIRLLRNTEKAEMLVFPNPATDRFQISYKADAGSTGMIMIQDVSGRRVFRKSIRITEGVNIFQYDASTWPRGVYTVTVVAEKEVLTQTFVRQ